MSRKKRASAQLGKGALSVGEQTVAALEKRALWLNRLPGTAVKTFLGGCLGMLIVYGVSLYAPNVNFWIAGPLMSGVGCAVGALVGRGRLGKALEDNTMASDLLFERAMDKSHDLAQLLRAQGDVLDQETKVRINQQIVQYACPQSPPPALALTYAPQSPIASGIVTPKETAEQTVKLSR